jgi:formamidopyrimidine-DNA glycosylase
MPELPDVEVARRRLQHGLRGATINAAYSRDRRILRPLSPGVFTRALVGRTVEDVRRRGKWLKVLLDDGTRVFSHLGMTGWWIERSCDSPKQLSERARIDVSRNGRPCWSVRYLDSRRFGRLVVAKDDITEWHALGPDPLIDGVGVSSLARALARSRRAIKIALMDQTILAGIGNILATEALWHARIDPRSRSNALTRADIGKLRRGLGTALRRELAARESMDEDERQDAFSVYGRSGSPCPRCGSLIARMVIAGRTTAFCKRCQICRGR